ncbi:MAG TPA: VanW family protein [Phototrophicaceae bacterium]|nr:VanW family protein [Phototrophicaceae bacterium]
MHPPDSFAPYPSQPAVNPWLIRLPVLAVSGVVLVVAALVVLVLGVQFLYNDKIIPGVSALGLNLGGLTRAQALAVLESHFTYDDEAVFTFRYGDRFWQLRAAELGVTFDADATLNDALTAGHNNSFAADLVAQANIWLNGQSVAPVVRYDQALTIGHLVAIANEINQPSKDATLVLNGAMVSTTPGQNGRTLDINATLTALEAAVRQLTTGTEITLVVNETPPLVWDAEAAATKSRAALSGPVTLIANTPEGGTLGPWTATVEQLAALLEAKLSPNADGTQQYDLALNVQAFRSYLEGLAPGLIATPQNARFHFNEDSGQLEVIQAAVNGRALDVDETLKRMEAAIFDPTNRIVPMAFTYTLPPYHDSLTAAELGITQLVGEATTYYTGSTQSRKNNVFEANSRFDGLIIAPGEVFSFNTYLGDISPETGFVQGKVIYGGRTVDGVGGGVCQVSTTIYRAALDAGFPITERHSHGYRVGFYEQNNFPPGLDAAIFQPDADFKFLNDTPYHLLVETSVFPGSDSIQFRLYSTNPGRQVVLEGPVIRDIKPPPATVYEVNAELPPGQSLQVDWAKEGADTTWTRIIMDLNGQEIRRDSIYTHYLPWAAVVQVASGDPRLSASG